MRVLSRDLSDRTAKGAVRDYTKIESPTEAYTLRTAAELNDLAKILQDLTREGLKDVLHSHIENRAAAKARKSVPDLLAELTEVRGMSWVDVARLVGVSVSAVRKWRKGGDSSPTSRLGLARLAALLDMLEEFAVADPAQWLEVKLPLPDGYTIRPLDLYEAGNLTGILAIAAQRQETETVLDETFPGWRDERRSDFEVVTAPDGMKMIQKRSP